MRNRQWIWLIVAVLVFVGAGVTSVAMNTWSRRTMAGALENSMSAFTSAAEPALPDEEFIARVDIEGTIVDSVGGVSISGGYDQDYLLDYIDRLADCDANAGILLYVDSGGGAMAASDDMYLKLMDYKAKTGRPVYAYFDGTACSGAYYIAMAADEIWANRNCLCVNIGVYISSYNLSGLFEKYGVEEVMIKSSENKGIGSLGQPWTDEQREIYQSIVDLYYEQFLEVVADGRGMTTAQVRQRDDGREMLAVQALEAGFIDGIGRWEEYRDQVLGYFGEDAFLYEEELPSTGGLLQMLELFYGKLEALAPRSDAELLREFVDENDGIVVMAYAG